MRRVFRLVRSFSGWQTPPAHTTRGLQLRSRRGLRSSFARPTSGSLPAIPEGYSKQSPEAAAQELQSAASFISGTGRRVRTARPSPGATGTTTTGDSGRFVRLVATDLSKHSRL